MVNSLADKSPLPFPNEHHHETSIKSSVHFDAILTGTQTQYLVHVRRIVGVYDHLIVVELVERHHMKAVAVPAGLCHQGHSLANEKHLLPHCKDKIPKF